MPSRITSLFVLLCAFALSSNAQMLVTDITVAGTPNGVAVNPKNNRIYVGITTSTGYAVAVIDGQSNSVIDTVALTTGSLVDAVNVANGRVYVAGCTYTQPPETCGVSVLDGQTNAVIATISIDAANGIGLEGIAVNPNTNRIYVADATNLVIDAIDGNSNTIVTKIPLRRRQPLGLAVDTDRNEVLAVINGDELDVIAGSSNKVVRRITVGSFNANVAVNSFTNRAYITNEDFAPSTVGVVNLSNFQVVTNVSVGNNPFGVCVDPSTNLIFVTNKGDGTMAVVNGSTNMKTGSITVSGSFIDVNRKTHLIYMADNSGATVVHVISE